MKSALYYILYTIIYLLSLLPLRVLYLISDGIFYPILRYIVRYRVQMVRRHLKESFPDKEDTWIGQTTDAFFHYLCDEFVESFKMLTISPTQLRKRMRFENTELIQEAIDRGQDCSLFLGHLGNWDWVASLPLWLQGNYAPGQIYHPIENESVDRVYLDIRSRWGGDCIPMRDTLRRMIRYRDEGRSWVIGFISDQVPLWQSIHHWLTFLGHENTPVFTGGERLSCRFGARALYVDISCERRGYYVGRFVLLADDCSAIEEKELTERFFVALEENIRRQPQIWLWSHNRWKRTRAEYETLINPVTGRIKH